MLETNEAFSVSLNSSNKAVRFHIPSTIVSIEDDDTATALIQEAEIRLQEGAGPTDVCVELRGLRERSVSLVLTPEAETARGLL